MIKTLQNTLKQDRAAVGGFAALRMPHTPCGCKEGFVLLKSVQDAIPIRRLWPDGIFQFGSKFSQPIRFTETVPRGKWW